MADAKVPLTFQIFKGDQLVRTETLTQDIVKIGKLSSSHLRIDDEQVSRMHAVIEVTGPDEVNIIDLGSTRGTIVNGQRVNKAKLQDGDTILLGDTKITLGIGAAEEVDEAPTRVNEAPGAAPSRPTAAPVSNQSGSNQVIASSPRPAAPAPAPAPAAPPPSYAAPAPAPAPAYAGTVPAPFAAAAPPPRPVAPARPAAPPVSAAAQFNLQTPALDMVEDATGSRAIEIAAMFEDQVHEVAHLTNPKGGKRSPVTKAFGGIAAASFVAMIACFIYAHGIASADKKAFNLHVEGDPAAGDPAARVPRPANTFEHDEVPIAVEIGFVFGILGTILFASLFAARSREESRPSSFRLGEGDHVEFNMGSQLLNGAMEFPLVRSTGNDWTFNFMRTWTGDVTVDGRTESLEQLVSAGRAHPSSAVGGAMEMQIPMGGRMKVDVGHTTFLVNSVPAPRRYPVPFALDTRFMWYFGASAAGAAAMIGYFQLMVPDGDNVSLDSLNKPAVHAELQQKPQDAVEQPKEDEKKDDGKEAGGTGTKQMGPEGKMGKKDYHGKDGQYMIQDRGADKGIAMQKAAERGANSGIVGAIASMKGDAFGSISGQQAFSSGFGQQDIEGGLTGDAYGEASGGFGAGVSGTGWGGGGTGRGTIGLGNYGTLGNGSGTGTGFGTGAGSGSGRGHKQRRPAVNLGQAEGVGDLDREMIRREIRKHKGQFEYCYEKQLLAKPELAGTVNTAFTITATGAVRGARGSGLDPTVASCVSQVMTTIQFPKPSGNGVVNVTYPFTFRQTGE